MSKVRIIFTRHAERLPSGKLSPEGLKNAKAKGQSLGSQAQALISYASDHPSKRAYDTAKIIAEASKIAIPSSSSGSLIEEVKDFSYDVFSPDLKHFLVKTKDMIDTATLKEAGLSIDRDENGKLKVLPEDLPKEKQLEIALLRQKNQRLGFDFWLNQPELLQRLAICIAHRLVSEISDSKKYTDYSSVVLNNVGHGCFSESLFEKAGISLVGGHSKLGISLKNDQHGGFIQPLESFYFEFDSEKEIPELLPVTIERNNGSQVIGLSLSYKKLVELNQAYKAWAKSS